jgi:peptide-methionine (S)-S-oxide reductase
MTIKKATLAGGCFWGMEEIIRKIPGILDTTVGYTGGHTNNPTYAEVCTKTTNHAEAIELDFDDTQISYIEILDYFFRMHNPTTLNQQGNDIGSQYRSAIFYHSEQQQLDAKNTIQKLTMANKFPNAIVTEVVPASTFWPAEESHQDYLQKFPQGYTCHYLRD